MDKSALVHNSIVYQYPCGDVDIICSPDMRFGLKGWESSDDRKCPAPSPRQKDIKSSGDDALRSMRRARAKVRRIALANQFDFFVTLTLDPEKIDRYDSAAVTRALSRWTDNMVRRHGLRYILVPELHKDGAFHFHGFFAGDDLAAVDSGHLDSHGHPIFNLPQWPYGFTAAIRLYGSYSSAVGYVCKYIGKQGGERVLGRWYYSGGKLVEPSKTYFDFDYTELKEEFPENGIEFDIPGSKLLVIHTKMEE